MHITLFLNYALLSIHGYLCASVQIEYDCSLSDITDNAMEEGTETDQRRPTLQGLWRL